MIFMNDRCILYYTHSTTHTDFFLKKTMKRFLHQINQITLYAHSAEPKPLTYTCIYHNPIQHREGIIQQNTIYNLFVPPI